MHYFSDTFKYRAAGENFQRRQEHIIARCTLENFRKEYQLRVNIGTLRTKVEIGTCKTNTSEQFKLASTTKIRQSGGY